MSRFDEEPDGDPHGECSAEIDRLKALNAELVAVLETIVRDADGRRISGNLILDENNPVIVAARAVLAEHKGVIHG